MCIWTRPASCLAIRCPQGLTWGCLRQPHGMQLCARGLGGKHMLPAQQHVVPAGVSGMSLEGSWGAWRSLVVFSRCPGDAFGGVLGRPCFSRSLALAKACFSWGASGPLWAHLLLFFWLLGAPLVVVWYPRAGAFVLLGVAGWAFCMSYSGPSRSYIYSWPRKR